MKPPDAIQLACALEGAVRFFFTNDDRLSKVSVRGIERIWALSDWRDDQKEEMDVG